MGTSNRPRRGRQRLGASRTLGYAFVPVPRDARMVRRRGELSVDEFDALSELYDRANLLRLARREPTPELTLQQLIEYLGWTKTPSALLKLLGRLRAKGWLSWTIRGRSIYVFTLHPERSEQIPSSAAPEPKQPSAGATSPSSATSMSGPSSPVVVPSSAIDAALTIKPETAPDPSDCVRGAQTSQSNPNLSVKGWVPTNDPPEIPWIPEVREALEAAKQQRRVENESALLAEAQQLVEAGQATWA